MREKTEQGARVPQFPTQNINVDVVITDCQHVTNMPLTLYFQFCLKSEDAKVFSKLSSRKSTLLHN